MPCSAISFVTTPVRPKSAVMLISKSPSCTFVRLASALFGALTDCIFSTEIRQSLTFLIVMNHSVPSSIQYFAHPRDPDVKNSIYSESSLTGYCLGLILGFPNISTNRALMRSSKAFNSSFLFEITFIILANNSAISICFFLLGKGIESSLISLRDKFN